MHPGQSITFTYSGKVDTGVAVGDELTNMAAISDDEELSNTSKVTVKVAAPAEDAVSDAGATVDSDAVPDSSSKCGDTFLLGWLFELIGIAK